MAYQLEFTNIFEKNYKKLSNDLKDKVDKALISLSEGKPYPKGLRVKKMQGYDSVFEASPTMSCRITFNYDNPEYIIFRNVGAHDKTLKNP
ncbi:type II toxin-antitoxin system RelE/ParE family toxin [Kurthia sibirica]|uniref:type II toxin-antitoxin system RelE/ParE family toxin n=1 Tax=Kurthia sibirica TaxID=202750 RepID=UPI00116C3F6B|nr:cytotoxin [Kurthia sibirica]GEK35441.1 hypothetical protein KSI01_29740 [Kurthia sibirica]